MPAVGLFDVTQFYGRRSWHPRTRAEENKRAGVPGLPALGSPPHGRQGRCHRSSGLSPRLGPAERGGEVALGVAGRVCSPAARLPAPRALEGVHVLWEQQKQAAGFGAHVPKIMWK